MVVTFLGTVTTSTSQSSTSSGSSSVLTPALHSDMAFSVVFGLLCLAALYVVGQTFLPAIASKLGTEPSDSSGNRISFFQIPYITWYLLHSAIATLGVIGVVILAVAGVIDSTTVAALLGGLFGYVLGSASAGRNSSSTTVNDTARNASPTVTAVINDTANPPATVTLVGSNLDRVHSVLMGDVPEVSGSGLKAFGSTALQVVVPPAGAGAMYQGGQIKIGLSDGTSITTSQVYKP
jgi:hypothetical protein